VNLTPKREKFAQAVASGKNHGEAYRMAFDAANMKPETIRKRASELAARGDVRGRIDELRAPIVEKAQITLESHLADLKSLRNIAAKEKQFSAAIAAEIARGKAAGVSVERMALELGGVVNVYLPSNGR
jgi:phage terminase small subunit